MTLTSSRTITARVTTVIGCSMFHSFYSLGVAGIVYFVISTVLNRKKRVTVGGRSNAPKSKSVQPQRYSSNDDYAR